MQQITLAQFIDAAIALCEERPGYVYPANEKGEECHYFPANGIEEGCLFGQAAERLGVQRAWLQNFEEVTAEQDGDIGVAGLVSELGITGPAKAVLHLRMAQSAQDQGEPWGEAPLDNLTLAKAAL